MLATVFEFATTVFVVDATVNANVLFELVAVKSVKPVQPVVVFKVTSCVEVKFTFSIPVIVAPAGAAVMAPTVLTQFNVSVPAPPLIASSAENVVAVEVSTAMNVSSDDVPVNAAPWSTPVVSVNVEPTTGVEVEPLPVVASIVAGVTVVLLVALTAVPPKVKPVTPPVVANLVATVPLVLILSMLQLVEQQLTTL